MRILSVLATARGNYTVLCLFLASACTGAEQQIAAPPPPPLLPSITVSMSPNGSTISVGDSAQTRVTAVDIEVSGWSWVAA